MQKVIQILIGAAATALLAACAGEPAPRETVAQTDPVSTAQEKLTKRSDSLVTATSFESALISEPMRYHLYLPPSYAEEATRTFPVIYWLHGSGGFPPGILQRLAGRFDRAMQQGKIPEALIVFPDGFDQSMWTNSKDNLMPMESILIQELIPHIDKKYRTISARSGRLLEGGSMGGYGAARLGFKYPNLFAGISMLNPGPMQKVMNVNDAPIVGREGAQRVFDTVYGGDQEYFQAQSPWQLAVENRDNISTDLKIRLILGTDDPIAEVNMTFSEHLNALGIEHDLVLLSDVSHNPRAMFAALGEDYWTFFNTLVKD